jgi:hypothetical protein
VCRFVTPTRRRALGPTAFRVALVAAALAGFLAPFSPETVERYYSAGLYPFLQRFLTGVSNSVPFALFDVLSAAAVLTWTCLLARDLVARRRGFGRVVGRLIVRTTTAAAVLYLGFLIAWGFNYRRVPLMEKLRFDADAVSQAELRRLAAFAVQQLNTLWGPARADDGLSERGVSVSLPPAFARAQALLGVGRAARPARPKTSILDPYFRAAGVEGMTDPYFHETLLVSSLLPVERPFVIAHEWSHLAGFADEGEANFVAWLACMHGIEPLQYSGWLFLYREAAASLNREDRERLALALLPGPRADLQAIAARHQRDLQPLVASAGWQVYDRYLKANQVESGAASYGEVIRLVLGTKMGPGWTPTLD